MRRIKLWLIGLSLILGLGAVLVGKIVSTTQGEVRLIAPIDWFKPAPVASVIPDSTPNAPQTFHYDSSTDLQKELDSINPQVLDSDF